jgi:hypothetical protein
MTVFGVVEEKGTRVATLPSEMRDSSPFDFAQGQNDDVN